MKREIYIQIEQIYFKGLKTRDLKYMERTFQKGQDI